MRLGVEWVIALAITVAAGALFLNGSFFSAWDALHIDLSINLVASHALRDGANPYGLTTLAQRAQDLGSPTILIYSQLFTSYIQPPTSALILTPLSYLAWRDATHVALVVNHVFLLAAIVIGQITVRPTLPMRWVIAGVAVMLAFYNQIDTSFALGQWDATLCLLLSIGFWGYARGKAPVAGAAIALGAAIKLIPVLLLIYFLWRREYRIVLWGGAIGLLLLVGSAAYVGTDVYHTYLTETLPALLKGSTQYANASIGTLIARSHSPDVLGNLPEIESLTEVPDSTTARLAGLAVDGTALLLVGLVLGWRRSGEPRKPAEALVFEYYLIVAVGLMISSVTWEFYVIWLLPAYAIAFLSAGRALPGPPWSWLALIAFVVAFIAMNYPGDWYLFDKNDFFYHPEWVPGTIVEKHVLLYHTHLDAVVFLRLGALAFFASTLSLLVLWRRFGATQRVEARDRQIRGAVEIAPPSASTGA